MKSQLDPGLYTNVFYAEVPREPVSVMVAPASLHSDLRSLRDEIAQSGWNVRVYRAGDKVLGYGEDRNFLSDKSFQEAKIYLAGEPQFCARCILEGFSDKLQAEGYRQGPAKGRVTLYEPEPYRKAAAGKLFVYRGYDLRTIFWRQAEVILFGLVVDVCWEIQDENGRRLNTSEIAQYNAMRELGQIQEELLPTGQINTEVARLRLQNHILPFVNQYCSFDLPCGGTVQISGEPIRVILGG